MKALVKKHAGVGLWMDDVPMPTVGDNDVLIKTIKTSICGTDVHIYKWDAWSQKRVSTPMIIGHEFVGTIAALGKNVRELKVGQRVTGEGHITCGKCPGCRKGNKHLCKNVRGIGYDISGCFAEYFTLPAENVFVLPDVIDDDLAAIFDPFGNAMHTALQANLAGEDILITGAGPIGCMAAAIARKAGARYVVITDINDYRLEMAAKLGATHTVNITKTPIKEAIKAIGVTEGFTVGMEMSGHPSGLADLVENAQHGATLSLLGILPPGCGVDWDLVIFNMLTLKGIYGREIFSTWYKMTHMLESGLDIKPIITHNFPVDDFEEGFKAMISGNSGKVILDWNT